MKENINYEITFKQRESGNKQTEHLLPVSVNQGLRVYFLIFKFPAQ